MNNYMLGKAVMIAWAGLGVKIENQKESSDLIELYISVPEQSYVLDANGNEMAGMLLAKRIKSGLSELEMKNLQIRARVRESEYWTKEMDKKAQEDMKKIVL